MTTQKTKQLRAQMALAFYEVHGRRPSPTELETHVKNAQLYFHAIIPAFFQKRAIKAQNKRNQLTLL